MNETTPEIEAWISAHSRRKLLKRLEAQLATAKRRGFKRTMLTLADVERLLSL